MSNINCGWESNLSLDEWKSECLDYFLKGDPDAFLEWQINGLLKLGKGKSKRELEQNVSNIQIDLSNCIFEDQLEVENYIYKLPVDFSNSTFQAESHFSFSKFEKSVRFQSVKFEDEVYFGSTQFNDWSIFNNSVFHELISFRSSIFKDRTEFNSVHFLGFTNFNSAIFEDSIFFNADNSRKKILNSTTFESTVNFENAVFKKIGNFDETKFITEYPNFLGVDNANTLLIFGGESSFNGIKIDKDSINNLIQLKRLAEEHGQIDNSMLFNKLEIKAKARIARNLTSPFYKPKNFFKPDFWYANLADLYGLFSDYGRSYIRPIFTYFILLFITFVIALLFSYKNIDINNNALNKVDNLNLSKERAAFEYSLYKSTGFVDFADTGKSIDQLNIILFNQKFEPIEMRIWGLFKSISSLICLFLFGLGIRNKFRIK